MIVLGFDYGKRYIGVAAGETLSGACQALGVAHAVKGVPKWHEIDAWIAKWQPKSLVVGLPLNMDGSEQTITKAARKFKDNLEKRTGLPCFFADERLTTYAASQEKKHKVKQELDAESARLILQGWMSNREC